MKICPQSLDQNPKPGTNRKRKEKNKKHQLGVELVSWEQQNHSDQFDKSRNGKDKIAHEQAFNERVVLFIGSNKQNVD